MDKGSVFWVLNLALAASLLGLVLWFPGAIFDRQEDHLDGPGVETLALTCTGCHGPGGISPGPIPSLAGRSFDVLATDLYAFRDGDYPGTIMKRFMMAFSDEDITALAAYFAAQPFSEPAAVSSPSAP